MKIWLGIITFAVTILLIATASMLCNKVEFNSAGILVSSLAVMVTLLVAWQIYATITSKEQIKNLEKDMLELRSDFEQQNLFNRNIIMGWHRWSIGEISLNDGELLDAYKQYIKSLKLLLDSPLPLSDPLIDNCIGSMEFCLDDLSGLRPMPMKKEFLEKNDGFNKINDELFLLVDNKEYGDFEFRKQLTVLKIRRNNIQYIKSKKLDNEEISKEDFDAKIEKIVLQRIRELTKQASRKRKNNFLKCSREPATSRQHSKRT